METFTVEALSRTRLGYRGYHIMRRWVSNPPQPDEWEFVHPEYDGPEDRRCGTAPTLEGIREAIEDLLDGPPSGRIL